MHRVGNRPAAAFLIAAAALGGFVGSVVLPGHSSGARPGATPPASSPIPRRAAPPASARTTVTSATTPAAGPVDAANLLPLAAFARAGLTVTVDPAEGTSTDGQGLSACTGEQALADVIAGEPGLHRSWRRRGKAAASEQISAVADRATAQAAAVRLLHLQEECQAEPATHWVYGPTQTVISGPAMSASWLGTYSGEQNTDGSAPRGEPPCGGVAVLRNENHVGVLEVESCADAEQLAALTLAAVQALG